MISGAPKPETCKPYRFCVIITSLFNVLPRITQNHKTKEKKLTSSTLHHNTKRAKTTEHTRGVWFITENYIGTVPVPKSAQNVNHWFNQMRNWSKDSYQIVTSKGQ